MVAVSLLAVIIVGLLAMFYQVQRAFRAGTSQVDVMEGGRAVMGIITRELQQAVPTLVDPTLVDAARAKLPVMNLLSTPSEPTLRPVNDLTVQDLLGGDTRENYLRDLCFIMRENDEWVGVAYRISNAVAGVGLLCRMEQRRTNDTNPDINRLLLSDLSYLLATSRVDNPNLFHPVADGIVHFFVEAYDHDGNIATNAQFSLPGQTLPLSYGFTNWPSYVSTNWMPAHIDLELGVLEPTVVGKFRARLDGNPTDPLYRERATNYLARQVGRTHLFRQRIQIKSVESGREQFLY